MIRSGAHPVSDGEDGRASENPEGPVLLFDGVCNLCAGVVRFIIPRDRTGRFRFAALQSEIGETRLRQAGLEIDLSDPANATLVLIEGGRAHVRSSAALRIAANLGGAWPLLATLLIVPRPLRDLVYRWVARNRYRWFGKKDVCYIPDSDESRRFLDPT